MLVHSEKPERKVVPKRHPLNPPYKPQRPELTVHACSLGCLKQIYIHLFAGKRELVILYRSYAI